MQPKESVPIEIKLSSALEAIPQLYFGDLVVSTEGKSKVVSMQILVKKRIQDAIDLNLQLQKSIYIPGEEIPVQLTIKNTGNEKADLQLDLKLSKNSNSLSPFLTEAIEDAQQKILIFTNKKGLASVLGCQDCKQIFYYTAPPFQSDNPTKTEAEKYKKYESFKNQLSKSQIISIREGRCQRLKINNLFLYKQKAVDSLAIIDLMSIPIKYPNVKKIIIISSDSDFVPAIQSLRELGIKTILYTYYERRRDTNFSRNNELIKSVHKYVLLNKEDLNNTLLKK